ncbi:hypothetical protein EDC94DRAFT_521467 [Helicostylum pulchrum]|nr:hypothetical protein EDC94DRAFT_521467 [Helicostylum pulchrum]
MIFDLNCQADSVTCEGVSTTLAKAADIITSVFQFESPLIINATFINFCQEYKDCGDNGVSSIGQAYPAISYIMVDTTDNITRMYPQPLLKQFTDLKVKPNWAPYDINAQFNTKVNWYFINNPNPISSKQTDFLTNVVHEMIHGLGFVTSWSDDLYRVLAPLFDQDLDRFITPSLLASTAFEQLLVGYDRPQPFWGFVEFPLDKFLNFRVESTNVTFPFTTITKQLNYFMNSNALFRSMIDLANTWYGSGAYNHAVDIYSRSVTELDVLAIIQGEPVIALETSVKPYSTGSSLCHVDQERYVNSAEYLMVYTAERGIGITQLNSIYPHGPIGPQLRKLMAGLGYKINSEKPSRPVLNYWNPPNGLVKTPSNPDPSFTVNLNGPARSPTVSSSAFVTTHTASSTIPTTFNLSRIINFVFLLPLLLLLLFL